MRGSTQTGERPRRQKWRIFSAVALGAALLAGGIFLLGDFAKANGDDGSDTDSAAADGKEEEEKAPIPVEVEPVRRGAVSSYTTATANLVAENQVTILSEVEGRLARLLVDEGDRVGRGQVLATLVRDDAEIGLKKAELKETNARLAFERGEDLMGKELISREDFDNFTMEYEIARQEAAEARWRLEKTTIRSPFTGQITERLIQEGQNIRPGDSLFQVTDLDPLIARIYLPERDIIGLEEGRLVQLTPDAAPELEFEGRIRQISPIVDTTTGTVKLTIEAVAPPAGVRPGSFVTVGIVRETRPDALLLPREAVIRELQKAHVFVAEDGVARKRVIQIGLEESGAVEAVSGVAAGDRVIVAGQGGLKDGTAIALLGAEEAADTVAVTAEAG